MIVVGVVVEIGEVVVGFWYCIDEWCVVVCDLVGWDWFGVGEVWCFVVFVVGIDCVVVCVVVVEFDVVWMCMICLSGWFYCGFFGGDMFWIEVNFVLGMMGKGVWVIVVVVWCVLICYDLF